MCEILSQAVNELLVYGQKCWKLTFDHQNPVQVDILKFQEIYLIPPAMAVAEGDKGDKGGKTKHLKINCFGTLSPIMFSKTEAVQILLILL